MISYLDLENGGQGPGKAPIRCARVEVIAKADSEKPGLYEVLVDLDNNRILGQKKLEGKHSYIDAEYMGEVERACLADTGVQAELRKLKLPEGSTPIVEPWAYATDGMHDMTDRVTMVRLLSLCLLRLLLISF